MSRIFLRITLGIIQLYRVNFKVVVSVVLIEIYSYVDIMCVIEQ